MEAVGVGASVIAFITLGLKCAKSAHEILSSAKGGSDHVARVERDVQGLLSTLERLARCRVIAER